jgi:hypothetical protein
VVNDLLWLTHEGYVVEYADSRLEAVPPPRNPPKPAVTAESAPAPAPTSEEPVPVAEAAPSSEPS